MNRVKTKKKGKRKSIKHILLTAVMIIAVLLVGCAAKGDNGVSFLSKAKTVGKDILTDDITDFYYTKENINFDANYQRYRFYVEEGKYYFFHETRERENRYGPCTEEDTTLKGTIELAKEQWDKFIGLVSGGEVRAREENVTSGGSGPWLYLYWTNDKGKYQQFSFESYDKETQFTDLCRSLAQI